MKRLTNYYLNLSSSKFFAFEKLVPVILLSIATWFYYYSQDLVLIYNDAMSHLNISRMVIDNLQPGFAQLGGVWLPVSHLLPLLFIWNDWAWHSGFAGSIFSMLSYIVSVWAIFRSVEIVTKNSIASFVAGLVFALNLNILYLQSTPMTEPLYVGLFSLSAYFFVRWITARNNTKYLLPLGILGFFQVLTRYDGWFVVGIEALLIGAYVVLIQKKNLREAIGKMILFSVPVVFGVMMWLFWNLIIFDDPLFFALGPYSARAQQSVIEESGQLITKGNLFLSTIAYSQIVFYNIGHLISFLAVIGSVFLFLVPKKQPLNLGRRVLVLVFFLSPVIFNILALFLGFSIVGYPGLGSESATWFNVRYGILALPLAAFLVGILSNWRKIAVIIVLEVILLQSYVMYRDGIVTIIDGKEGSSSFNATLLSDALKERVDEEDRILMSIYSFNPVAFKSDVQMNQIIHEGVSGMWADALKTPEKYAEWIVMANTSGDIVYAHLVDKGKSEFLRDYELVFTGNNSSIYRLKNSINPKLEVRNSK